MAIAGPFYFAWADATETTFGVSHHRMDEYVFSAKRILREGEKPLLELVIENPHVGLLNPARKYWAWFSWFNGTSIVPLFFGRIVGIPSNVQGATITIQLISWPTNYVQQLQRLAETLKVAPFYDLVFIEPTKWDDPRSIFEAHSKLECIDPVTLTVSASAILSAEDGNLVFNEADHFYDSLDITIEQPPLDTVLIDATVSWTQTARGTIDMGNNTFMSYSGDGIIAEWPKPLTSLQSGWSVFNSTATDVFGIANALTASFGWSWTNTEKTHNDGDTLSLTINQTVPQIGDSKNTALTIKSQTGILDPFATDQYGDPAPINIPMSLDMTMVYCPLWKVNTSLVLRYDAARQRTERVVFAIKADLQPTILDPTVSQNSETITKNGIDVGLPVLQLSNWTTIAGTHVNVGQVVFPDDPQLPGGRTAQIAVVAGTAGTVEPEFSDVVGDPTTDGGVTWSSLGTASATEAARDWAPVTNIPLGSMILPREPFYTSWVSYTQTGRAQFPQVGTPVSAGQIISTSAGNFQVCTLSGQTNTTEPTFSSTWGAVTNDGSAQWTSLGTRLPSGTTYFIAVQAGVTGASYVIPPFNETLNANTTDGTVIWKSIGSGEIPAGGKPGNVVTSNYFPTDRGRRSIEYLISVARARIMYRARAARENFTCSYLRGTEVTLRKTVTLYDGRISGGVALGKVIGSELIADGPSGTFTCRVTAASAVGLDTVISEVAGTPTYVSTGYVSTGYQLHDGVVILVPSLSDVGYTPPQATVSDDGLSFTPLTRAQVLISETTHGTLAAQETGILSAFDSMKQAAVITQQPAPQNAGQSVLQQTQIALANSNSVALNLQRNAVWYDLQLKPINAGPFGAVYHVRCTNLSIPKMIDLQTESTT